MGTRCKDHVKKFNWSKEKGLTNQKLDLQKKSSLYLEVKGKKLDQSHEGLKDLLPHSFKVLAGQSKLREWAPIKCMV